MTGWEPPLDQQGWTAQAGHANLGEKPHLLPDTENRQRQGVHRAAQHQNNERPLGDELIRRWDEIG